MSEQITQPIVSDSEVKEEESIIKPYLYRFLIHVPTLYENMTRIEPEKINDLINDIEQKFGSLTRSSHQEPSWEGVWRKGPGEKFYRDHLFIMQIDVKMDKGDDAIKFFSEFRKKYEEILQQKVIYIVYHRVTQI